MRTDILPQRGRPGQLAVEKLVPLVDEGAGSAFQALEETLSRLQEVLLRRQEVISRNRDVLPSGVRKGEAFILLEAELLLNAPSVWPEGRRVTVDEKQAWLQAEMRKDPRYQELLRRLHEAQGELERLDLEADILNRRYQALLALVNYYTAILNAGGA